MYVKRIRLENYGPIPNLDIKLPFDDDRPKPVVLVGENGSGKSIVLSHIVNGMLEAKHDAYPESRELDDNKVFKIRDSQYIAVGSEYYYGRVDFERSRSIEEIFLRNRKESGSKPSMQEGTPAHSLWQSVPVGDNNRYRPNFAESRPDSDGLVVADLVSANCLLYFPSDRFEEPAWLNRANLLAQPSHTVPTRVERETDRRVLVSSPLRALQDWLFSVAYDRAAFEARTTTSHVVVKTDSGQMISPLWLGHRGDATKVYELVIDMVRRVVKKSPAVSRLGIGGRHRRNLSIMSNNGVAVPSIFQLSSGEAALLALFLAILRDFDFRENRSLPFSSTKDVRGLVVIDEVDLHLHARYQHEVLPELIKMFPRVQFVMTTHSPLFVLGLGKVLGEEGFGLHELPSGSPIAPEEFGEFGEAYQAFRNTTSYRSDIRRQIEAAQRPILFVEGSTDCQYLPKAAALLEKNDILARFDLRPSGGSGRLGKLWNPLERLSKAGAIRHIVVLLYDPESNAQRASHGKVHRLIVPKHTEHQIAKGIEHLFDRDTLMRTRDHKAAFIDIEAAHESTVRGEATEVPEKWSVNKYEKTNLCNWLCENGTAEDFRHFEPIFAMLEEVLAGSEATTSAEG